MNPDERNGTDMEPRFTNIQEVCDKRRSDELTSNLWFCKSGPAASLADKRAASQAIIFFLTVVGPVGRAIFGDRFTQTITF